MNPLETYLRELRDIRSTGAAVPETSYYGCLERLLNDIGKKLKPKVRCIINLANRGAGIPDGGLFTPDQLKKSDADPMQGQAPSRGVIEVKSTADAVADIAAGEQVERYCKKYGLVLVTNYRDFTLVARDPAGRPVPLESYRLAASEDEFWSAAAHPRTAAEKHGERFAGYLMRAMQHNAPLADPKDLAWFLASYARDALARIKGPSSPAATPWPALASLRKALEESLGMQFRGDRGEHFFESTLIQTLFYGVFSAWVLWAKEHPPTDTAARFDWMHSAAYLRVPVLRKLFHEVADPGQLDELNLSEVLNWATTALNRVDRAAFFAAFEQHHAVQYFYEPFLEAYDPELRKQLGVWYTPPEIVQYMVKRVDRVLREELAVEDGLAELRRMMQNPNQFSPTGQAALYRILEAISPSGTRQETGGLPLSLDTRHASLACREPRIIGIDFDGTLADTGAAKQQWAAEHKGLRLTRSQCNRSRMLAAGMTQEAYNEMLLTVCDREHTLAAVPCPGAIAAVQELSKIAVLYVVTDRGEFQKWKDWCQLWLDGQGLSDLFQGILSTEFSIPGGAKCRKGDICREHSLTVLIDDDLSNLTGLGRTAAILYDRDGGAEVPLGCDVMRASHWRIVPALCRSRMT